jgi:hypothetical protein
VPPVSQDDLLSLSQAVALSRSQGRPISRQGLKWHLLRGSLTCRRIGHAWVVRRADLVVWIGAHPASTAQLARAAA